MRAISYRYAIQWGRSYPIGSTPLQTNRLARSSRNCSNGSAPQVPPLNSSRWTRDDRLQRQLTSRLACGAVSSQSVFRLRCSACAACSGRSLCSCGLFGGTQLLSILIRTKFRVLVSISNKPASIFVFNLEYFIVGMGQILLFWIQPEPDHLLGFYPYSGSSQWTNRTTFSDPDPTFPRIHLDPDPATSIFYRKIEYFSLYDLK